MYTKSENLEKIRVLSEEVSLIDLHRTKMLDALKNIYNLVDTGTDKELIKQEIQTLLDTVSLKRKKKSK